MKKILAGVLSLTMVLAFAGCSESTESDSSKADTTSATTTTTTATSEETTTTTTTTAETTTTTTVAEESTAGTDSTAEPTYENNVYTGPFYSFNIDESKWTMSTAIGVDCMFTYTGDATQNPDLATATVNVVSMTSELLGNTTAADYADTIKTQYESMDGYTVTNDKEGTFNGMDAYLVDVTAEISSITMYIHQVIIPDGDNLAVITYGADDAAYDDMQAEFQTILDSFTMM